MTTRERLEV